MLIGIVLGIGATGATGDTTPPVGGGDGQQLDFSYAENSIHIHTVI